MRWTLLTLALALLLCSAAVAQQLSPVYPKPPTSQSATPTFLVNPATGAIVPGTGTTTPVIANGTLTIATGGTAVTAAATATTPRSCIIQNPLTAAAQNIATAEDLWVNWVGGTAVAQSGTASFQLVPGAVIVTPQALLAISVIGATTAHRFSAACN